MVCDINSSANYLYIDDISKIRDWDFFGKCMHKQSQAPLYFNNSIVKEVSL